MFAVLTTVDCSLLLSYVSVCVDIVNARGWIGCVFVSKGGNDVK